MTTPELPALKLPSLPSRSFADHERYIIELREVMRCRERLLEARERILLARIAELEAQRDFLVEEYGRGVKCGPQGYIHCAMHLYNAITNARVDATIAAVRGAK